MLITHIPDHCLLIILDYCDMDTLTTLSIVCTKLREFLINNFFWKITNYSHASIEDNIAGNFITVTRLAECINPTNFQVKIQSLQTSKDLARILPWT